MALTVRAYAPADRAGCERIFQAVQRLVVPEYSHSSNEPEEFETVTAGEELWVAEGAGARPGAIEGFVSIWRPDRFIHHLYVDPACHRRGIGRALLSRAIRQCEGQAELKCGEANRAAQSFYMAAGLRPAGWGWSPNGPWIRYRA